MDRFDVNARTLLGALSVATSLCCITARADTTRHPYESDSKTDDPEGIGPDGSVATSDASQHDGANLDALVPVAPGDASKQSPADARADAPDSTAPGSICDSPARRPVGTKLIVTEYAIPTPKSSPEGLVVDPSGRVWFAEYDGNAIGLFDPSTEKFSEYPVPAKGNPEGVALGPDGSVWFTEYNANIVGKVSPSGVGTEYSIPTPNSTPMGVTAGPDGNIWFTESANNKKGDLFAGVATRSGSRSHETEACGSPRYWATVSVASRPTEPSPNTMCSRTIS